MRYLLPLIVVGFLIAIGVSFMLQPECEPSYTLRGVPYAIQVHECAP